MHWLPQGSKSLSQGLDHLKTLIGDRLAKQAELRRSGSALRQSAARLRGGVEAERKYHRDLQHLSQSWALREVSGPDGTPLLGLDATLGSAKRRGGPRCEMHFIKHGDSGALHGILPVRPCTDLSGCAGQCAAVPPSPPSASNFGHP